jgi:hypothetical protein
MKSSQSFLAALRSLEDLKRATIIEDYAIAGAMALVFWAEPIPTYDLDVLVLLPEQDTPIVSLGAIYQWASAQGHSVHAEHVVVAGVPVQFLPSHNKLTDEAIETAATLDYQGVAVRVVRPEYLAVGADGKTPGTRRGPDGVRRDRSKSPRGPDPSIQTEAMTERSRPTPELMSRLRQGKAELHARRTRMSLKEKVAIVLELQRICLPLLERQRPLKPWERPWDVEP